MSDLKIIKLNSKSNIYMKKTKKFKSIEISVVYKTNYDYKSMSAFNILAKYLGNCSIKYQSIEQLNKYVDNLYGTSLGIKFDCTGSLSTFSVFANYINPKFVKDDTLNEKVIELLYDTVYNPLINDKVFDETIFEICKESCLVDAESLNEYNLRYVVRKLKEIISENDKSSHACSIHGNIDVLNSLTYKNIYRYYKKLLNAPFDIYITGDFKYKDIISLLKKYYKNIKTKKIQYNVFNQIKDKTYKPLIIKKDVKQSKVAIAYRIPILFNNPAHYAFRVARLVLCGTLSSKFYKVIREQLGLCYSINSYYSSYYGAFIITTGVDSQNIDKVITHVDNQIKQLQNGNITDEEFIQAKEAILNDMYSIDDSIFGVLDMIKTYQSFSAEFDYKKELEKYESVTKQDVINASKLLSYVTYVTLDKE